MHDAPSQFVARVIKITILLASNKQKPIRMHRTHRKANGQQKAQTLCSIFLEFRWKTSRVLFNFRFQIVFSAFRLHFSRLEGSQSAASGDIDDEPAAAAAATNRSRDSKCVLRFQAN